MTKTYMIFHQWGLSLQNNTEHRNLSKRAMDTSYLNSHVLNNVDLTRIIINSCKMLKPQHCTFQQVTKSAHLLWLPTLPAFGGFPACILTGQLKLMSSQWESISNTANEHEWRQVQFIYNIRLLDRCELKSKAYLLFLVRKSCSC